MSVHCEVTMCCCQLEINLQQAHFARSIFKRCFQCQKLIQTNHVSNLVPESPLICNQKSPLFNTNFSTGLVSLAVSDFWLYAMKYFYKHY